MNEIKILDKGEKFTHVSAGDLRAFEGKLFTKEASDATSCEISFGTLPTGAEAPFFHSHRNNEENYVILGGRGRFQVDDEVLDIAEGSVIRVATRCDRNLKCTSEQPMTYICIQAAEGSLGDYTASDADITDRRNLL